mgnify:CR=1 FL=1
MPQGTSGLNGGVKMTFDIVSYLLGNAKSNSAKEDASVAAALADHIYPGSDLSEKFANEVAVPPYSGDPWAWIKARIQAGDFTGIHVNDYIPFTTTDNKSLKACVGGINTYKGYGDTAVGNHIDFICRELFCYFLLITHDSVYIRYGTESFRKVIVGCRPYEIRL